MDFIHQFVDFFLHLDKHLGDIIANYGTLTYGILFAIVFCETGLVVTPFLPGDSLLFAVGALSHAENAVLNPIYCYLLLTAAALLGDNSNYWIGRFFGPKVFGKFVKKKYMDQTHDFYEKHGILTLIIAQFAPIIRTFAPFVAGVGRMTYSKFVVLNLIGVLSWTTIFVWAGYFFGGMPAIQKNFHYVILAIIVISLTPIALEVFKVRSSAKKKR